MIYIRFCRPICRFYLKANLTSDQSINKKVIDLTTFYSDSSKQRQRLRRKVSQEKGYLKKALNRYNELVSDDRKAKQEDIEKGEFPWQLFDGQLIGNGKVTVHWLNDVCNPLSSFCISQNVLVWLIYKMFVILLCKTYLKRPFRRADITVRVFLLVIPVERFWEWFFSPLSECLQRRKGFRYWIR